MKLFTNHPNEVDETYWQHFRFATKTGLLLVCAGIACLVHGVLPFLFIRTASGAIRRIHDNLDKRRMKAWQRKMKTTDWVI